MLAVLPTRCSSSRCVARSLVGFIVLVAPFCGGCCLWRNQNPIKESVVASRQYSQQGVNALERHDLEEAERLLGQAVRACPNDADARRHYADLLWAQGRTNEALTEIDVALTKAPEDVGTLLRAAELNSSAGRVEQALKLAQRAIDLDPKSADAWAVRGRILLQTGQTRQALADLQRSLHCDPRRRDVLQLSAELYRTLGEPHRALINLQTLADTYGPDEEPQQLYVDEALVFAALDRHHDAARVLREAQRRGPATPQLYALLAEAESAAGHVVAAQDAAQRALALAPDDPRCQRWFARIATAAGADGIQRR